jgi:hypothetical protein
VEVERGADPARSGRGPELIHREAVGQGEVVRDRVRRLGVDEARRVDAHQVSVLHHGLRLVDGQPGRDVVGQGAEDAAA